MYHNEADFGQPDSLIEAWYECCETCEDMDFPVPTYAEFVASVEAQRVQGQVASDNGIPF